jgi:hypothetical protein
MFCSESLECFPGISSRFLTCICLSSRLFRVTLEISRAECNIDVTPGTLNATDTYIGYHVTRFEASRKVILHTRYVCACVGAGGERCRRTKMITIANRCGPCYLTCDMYKSSLRHIHDPVLSSLKMKGIRLLFLSFSLLFQWLRLLLV